MAGHTEQGETGVGSQGRPGSIVQLAHGGADPRSRPQGTAFLGRGLAHARHAGKAHVAQFSGARQIVMQQRRFGLEEAFDSIFGCKGRARVQVAQAREGGRKLRA